ncbi:MAG TPA: hypothetical protein VH592_19555 [Gemmataceae bacterium]
MPFLRRLGDPFVEPRHVRLYREAGGAWHAQNNQTALGLDRAAPPWYVAMVAIHVVVFAAATLLALWRHGREKG